VTLKQIEIVYGADAKYALVWGTRADAVHERAASGTEVVGHSVAGGDSGILAEGLQDVAAAQVLYVRILDREVRSEHRSGEFVAVEAVAHKGID